MVSLVEWMVRDRNDGPVFGSNAESYPDANSYADTDTNSNGNSHACSGNG